MSNMDRLVNDLTKAIGSSEAKKTQGYDTPAIVTRVEGSTAWVHIPGGIDETPVKRTVNAIEGDEVQVRVSGGRAWIVGNATAPPTDDRVANIAQSTAVRADQNATEAKEYAVSAKEAADEAWSYADSASTAANVANNSANSALTQLSIVEDVAGTLNWISEHGTYVATTDTTVDTTKVYFVLEGGDYVPIASPDPTANPQSEGWYVLDVSDSQSDYIMSHLAVTSAGLWVLPSGINTGTVTPATGESEDTARARLGSGYKMLLSNSGMILYDGTGSIVSTYGESIQFSSTRPQRIGGNNVYIEYYDSNNDTIPDSLRIVGASITFSNGSSAEESINTAINTANNILIYDHTYVINNNIATFTAHVYRGGVDIISKYEDSDFTWYKRTENGDTYLGNGKTININLSMEEFGYRGYVVGKFTTTVDSPLLDDDNNELQTGDGETITGRTESEGYVKVTELPIQTPVLSDYIMGIGAEQEYRMSVQALKELIGGTMSYDDLSDKPQIEGVTLTGNKAYEDIPLQRITNSEMESMLTI